MSETLAADFRPSPVSRAVGTAHSTGTASVTALPELRSGRWTRYGDSGVLADDITENTLSVLAETTRSAARSQGYAIGWTEGRRDAEIAASNAARRHLDEAEADRQRCEAEHRAAIAALESAAAQLLAAIDISRRDIDERASGLAFELTRALVGSAQERETDDDVVRRVLAATPQQPGVTVRLNPRAGSDTDLSGLTSQGLTVIVDPTMERGDALVETDTQVIDLRVSAALARVRESLR